MREVAAISISDIHLHNWSQFNKDGQRIEVSKGFIKHVNTQAEALDVPILFSGDLWQTPEGLSTKTFFIFSEFFDSLRASEAVWYGIPGNHDQVEVSEVNKPSPNLYSAWCYCFPEMFKDISFRVVETDKMVIAGIPYILHNIGLKDYVEGELSEMINAYPDDKLKVLLIHTDLMGAEDPSGREVGQVENIPRRLARFFKDWDLVLAGHIHKPQTLWGDNIIMVGSPYQQRKSDSGCNMGYWLIYTDGSHEFVPYNAPEFKYYREGEEHEDTNDYWIKIPKEKKLDKKKAKKFSSNMNRTKLARKYVRAKGIKDEDKLNALTEILNRTDD